MKARVALFVYPFAGVDPAELERVPFSEDPGPEWVRVSEWVEVNFPELEKVKT